MTKVIRRVCLVYERDKPNNPVVYSSIKKAISAHNIGIKYHTVLGKLRRTFKAKGKRTIEILNSEGEVLMIQVKQVH